MLSWRGSFASLTVRARCNSIEQILHKDKPAEEEEHEELILEVNSLSPRKVC